MAPTIADITAPNDYGYIIIDPLNSSTTKGITQAFPTGKLWSINPQVFQQHLAISRRRTSGAPPSAS
jgi:hypothetical protein